MDPLFFCVVSDNLLLMYGLNLEIRLIIFEATKSVREILNYTLAHSGITDVCLCTGSGSLSSMATTMQFAFLYHCLFCYYVQ